MINWFKKRAANKQKAKGRAKYEVVAYGRYTHKPTIRRALPEVTGIPVEQLEHWTKTGVRVMLNGQDLTSLDGRLSSGKYEIRINTKRTAWTFHIL
jgi:hypothetical protein